MHDTLLEQGLDLMLYGMGTVLAFLTLLVIATLLMSTIMQRFFPDPQSHLPASDDPDAEPASAAVAPKTLAIIKAALDQHRAKRR